MVRFGKHGRILPLFFLVEFRDDLTFLVKDSRIYHIYSIYNYELKNGLILSIEQRSSISRHSGDKVYINNLPAPDGKYKLGVFSSIKVKDGQIV